MSCPKPTTTSYCLTNTLIILLLLSTNNITWKEVHGEQHPVENDEGPLSEVPTVVGLDANLPCDLMPGTMIADKVSLVIWYRQGNDKPVYTFDARGRPLHQAIPWADEQVFKHKAHFYYDTNPPALRIKNIQTKDAGLYKCRVDFNKSPTRNWRINVTVLVPPTQLTILNHHGAELQDQKAGPYLEGDSINLTCLSSGGVPPPRVSWWREHALVDESFQVLPDGTVRNVLHLKNISRKDLLTVYTCQATNGHAATTLTKKVVLDLNLPPLSLLLQGLNHALVAGTRTHVTCTAVGARPPPNIVWTKGGQLMSGATQSNSVDGNTTVSEIVLLPLPEDNERQVVCSISLTEAGVSSPKLQEGHTTIMTSTANGQTGFYLKDSRVLNVTHAPIVTLSLGAPLDPNNLLKGTDVYLECEVRANPGITRVEWYHNDKQLHSSRGIIIANQTLVLQGISKSSHGQYFCRATNIQGSVSSNEVYLDVKYPPSCSANSTIIRAALKQTINITCQVDANPLDNLNYKWHFNNSLDNLIELPEAASHNKNEAAVDGGIGNANDAFVPATLPLQTEVANSRASVNAGYYQRNKRKHVAAVATIETNLAASRVGGVGVGQQFVLGRHGSVAATNHVVSGILQNIHFEDDVDNEHTNYEDDDEEEEAEQEEEEEDALLQSLEEPYTQMVYSNVLYGKNHYDAAKQQQQHQQQMRKQLSTQQQLDASSQFQLQNERKRFNSLHKQHHIHQQHRITTTPTTPLHNVYMYHIETYESFGAISCIASSPMGRSERCWYHIQPADLPEAVKNCTSYNATANSLQIQCIPGYDGGIPQHFHAQIYDEINRQILYNASFKYSDFTLKRLPSDSVFVIKVTAVNAQGFSKTSYRLRARTLSAPLLRTASSTAVLVQLTPLLGAMVGVIATLVLVAICIVIFLKFRTKRTRHTPGAETTTTEADKGSAEPLSRNMGSHSSLEDKNPDVVPQETNSEDEFHLEEKAFDRLNIESQRILYTPPSRLNTASPPPPPSLSPTFGKQYGELSLTTNPAFSLYNTPQRAPATQRPVYTAPPTLLSTRTPPNIYTRIPGRAYLPAYETRTSPTSPYGSTTTCTVPLLGGQSNGSLQTQYNINGTALGLGTCNTLPHPGSQGSNGISSALTSSVTSGNITIGAAHSLLTSPRTHSAHSSGNTQSPLLAGSNALLGSGTYETVSS